MKIGFISIKDPEDVAFWSGLPYFMLNAFREKGVNVEVIGPLKRGYKYLFAFHKLFAKWRRHPIDLGRVDMAVRSYGRQIQRLIEGKDFDALFTFSSVAVADLPAGPPVVLWIDAVYESIADYYPGVWSGGSVQERAREHSQEQRALDRIDRAVYSSQWAADDVAGLYNFDSHKTHVVEFGPNLVIEHGRDEANEWIEERLHSPCNLLWIGVDWKRKGGDIAFEATRLLNQRGISTTLHVVGCESPSASFVQNYGFIHKQSDEGRARLGALLQIATFFILPTRAEAAGVVFCEAAAFGLPILSSATGGVGNYVRERRNGFCLPLDAAADAYADVIQRLLEDQAEYRHLSAGSFDLYESSLNWTVASDRLLDVMRQAVEERNAPASALQEVTQG